MKRKDLRAYSVLVSDYIASLYHDHYIDDNDQSNSNNVLHFYSSILSVYRIYQSILSAAIDYSAFPWTNTKQSFIQTVLFSYSRIYLYI